jgi:hypothetical protein
MVLVDLEGTCRYVVVHGICGAAYADLFSESRTFVCTETVDRGKEEDKDGEVRRERHMPGKTRQPVKNCASVSEKALRSP